MDWSLLIPQLLPVLTPLFIAGLKKAVGHIPTYYLPIIAPVFAGLLDAANAYAGGGSLGWWQASLLGLAGVGVREIVDQARQVVAGKPA
jgi:hypothetical protein